MVTLGPDATISARPPESNWRVAEMPEFTETITKTPSDLLIGNGAIPSTISGPLAWDAVFQEGAGLRVYSGHIRRNVIVDPISHTGLGPSYPKHSPTVFLGRAARLRPSVGSQASQPHLEDHSTYHPLRPT